MKIGFETTSTKKEFLALNSPVEMVVDFNVVPIENRMLKSNFQIMKLYLYHPVTGNTKNLLQDAQLDP